MTDAKLVISLIDNANHVKMANKLNKSNIPVVAIKLNPAQSLPDGVLDFAEIMNIKSNVLLVSLLPLLTNIYF